MDALIVDAAVRAVLPADFAQHRGDDAVHRAATDGPGPGRGHAEFHRLGIGSRAFFPPLALRDRGHDGHAAWRTARRLDRTRGSVGLELACYLLCGRCGTCGFGCADVALPN